MANEKKTTKKTALKKTEKTEKKKAPNSKKNTKQGSKIVQKNKSLLLFKNITLLVFAGVFVWLLISLGFMHKDYTALRSGLDGEKKQELLRNPIERLGEYFVLPEEEPQIIIIEGADFLREKQEFFANVQNGDHVILYSDKAFIYRPEIGKVVNVGPISSTQSIESENRQSSFEEATDNTS